MSSRIPSDRDPLQPHREAGAPPAPLEAGQLLPPVEPPSAGFLLQLFVIPAVIVACVVGIWFLLESAVRGGAQDVDEIVRGLQSPSAFQQAKDLADMLRVPQRYPELRTNRELARKLAALLDEQVATGDAAEGAVNMRYFLASALGEFHVDDGLGALVNAATRDANRDVRRRAVNAIAVLAGTFSRLDPPRRPGGDELVAALVELAHDKEDLIRSETAFAIGVVAAAPDPDSKLIEALIELADDPYTDARFNAAAALARLGNAAAAPALAEMFDPDAIASSVAGEKPLAEDQSETSLRGQQAYKRNTILTSALSALDMLLASRPPAGSLDPVEEALAKLVAAAPTIQDPSPLPDEVVSALRGAYERVKQARGR